MYLLGSAFKFWGSLMVVSWFEHLMGSQNLLHSFGMSDFCSGTAVLLIPYHRAQMQLIKIHVPCLL